MADWGAIEQQHQREMGRNNRRENASRVSHDYKVGDKVLLKKPGKNLRKVEVLRTGPHTVGHHLLIPWSPSSWSVVDPKKYWAYMVFYIFNCI
jgi:hypothetical protein